MKREAEYVTSGDQTPTRARDVGLGAAGDGRHFNEHAGIDVDGNADKAHRTSVEVADQRITDVSEKPRPIMTTDPELTFPAARVPDAAEDSLGDLLVRWTNGQLADGAPKGLGARPAIQPLRRAVPKPDDRVEIGADHGRRDLRKRRTLRRVCAVAAGSQVCIAAARRIDQLRGLTA